MSRERHVDRDAGPDDRLVSSFVRGEAGTIARVEALANRVVRFRGYYVPAEDREDVVQEAMLEVCKAIARPERPVVRDFAALIRAIAHQRCVDWMRRRRPTEPIDAATPYDGKGPEATVLERERRNLALLIIRRLREPCRQLIRLHAGVNLTYGQIAELQGRTEGAVRTQMSECLKEARATREWIQRLFRTRRNREGRPS